MPIYSYTAINRNGKEFSSEKTAKDKEDLKNTLREEGLLLIDAIEETAAGAKHNTLASLETWLENMRGVSLFEKMIFAKNLSVMVRSGLPLTRALSVIGEETKNEHFKIIIERINESVIKGNSFAQSLAGYKKIFGDFFVNMVQAGEISGNLDRIMLLLARQMKKDYDLRSRVRGAMLYPAVILIVLCLIGALMMIYVVPTLAQALTDLNVELPWSTKMIIGFSNLFVEYSILLLAVLAFIGFMFFRFIRSALGRPLWDKFVLHIPLFGALIKKMNTARITRVLSYLLSAGMPIIRALEIAGGVVGNTNYKNSIADLIKEVAQGRAMGKFFHSRQNLYDPLVGEMIAAGEETGKISEMLLDVAMFFEQDINDTTKNMSSIIEPFLMVTIGIIVGFFAISVMQPIYSSLGNV